ncbi:hypothetical protein [Bdellovibrio sp. NC01]|uniref:hypothetical protein n=1 Tax=Bdellovibrio sp. NC01 TaxID=2220073 RepID=UPI0011594B34|nr:hypothetical protein [Bdellovibrio sp. NC01]QDK36673.1 hypothetical protein DOE51_03185 [Bdellovibrio sp. NC01]
MKFTRPMKIAALLLLCFASTSFAEEKFLDMSEPPFYMPSYDEFKNLQQDQKEFYLDKVLPLAKDLPNLGKLNKSQLDEASEWYEGWGDIRKKVYLSCQDDKDNEETCDKLVDLRVDAINLKANQKEQNRDADEKAQSEKSAKADGKKKAALEKAATPTTDKTESSETKTDK